MSNLAQKDVQKQKGISIKTQLNKKIEQSNNLLSRTPLVHSHHSSGCCSRRFPYMKEPID